MIEKIPEERELAPRDEERFTMPGGKTLFVSGRPGAGYQVWIDTTFDFSGVRVGAGATKPEAREAALETLLGAVRTLRGLQGGAESEVHKWTT